MSRLRVIKNQKVSIGQCYINKVNGFEIKITGHCGEGRYNAVADETTPMMVIKWILMNHYTLKTRKKTSEKVTKALSWEY